MSKSGAEKHPRSNKVNLPLVDIIAISTSSDDVCSTDVLNQVFPTTELASEASADALLKHVTISNLGSHLDKWLEDELKQHNITECDEDYVGRLGPDDVMFQFNSHIGSLIMDSDRLGLSSQSNFISMKANCCVFKGKWMYEVMLGSMGVMQIGWCTAKSKFSQEEGVGDTEDSYAYDGSRQRKWNKCTQKYGEAWCTGDVITCTLDCDLGIASFYRNGRCLGEAFTDIKLGPEYAYFPAVSLSFGESLRASFGATPIKYPVPGFKPLQKVPHADVIKTNLLLGYMEKLLYLDCQNEESMLCGVKSLKALISLSLAERRSRKATILLILSQVFDKLAPVLRSSYVIEACLMKLLLKLVNVSMATEAQPLVTKLLDYMWSLMQSFEINPCIENLMLSLLSAYRFAPATTDFIYPKLYLSLILALLRHDMTRRYLLQYELFDKIKFPMFLHIKTLDDRGLEQMLPIVWWNSNTEGEAFHVISDEEQARKDSYMKSCEQLRVTIEEIEDIQIEILKTVLCHTDCVEGKTSRMLFLEKFRKFVKENKLNHWNRWPLPVSHCFFHRMVRVLRFYWDDFVKEDPDRFVLSKDAFMPVQEFWSDSRDYFDLLRCGGSMSHINKVLGAEVNRAQGIKVSEDGHVKKDKWLSVSSGYPKAEMPSGNTLMEMLDGTMLLYQLAAHRQLSKMNSLMENIQEFIRSYKDTLKKLDLCPVELVEVHNELLRAKSVFLEKITEQARQICWVQAVVCSKQKQEDVAWLLAAALKTVKKASEYKLLFQYMPEFYLDIVVSAYNALKNFFHPTITFESLPDYKFLVREFAQFLVDHCSDSRIVVADTRDTIIQALACFTCYEQSLKVLEALPIESCKKMLKSLIAPYENRSWAQTNWILVRIWKGCGFGFRYTHLPHLVPSKVQLTEFGSASLQRPCPSPYFQSLLCEMLNTETEMATKFLDTLLNQLNWAFSEFIGIMQEIHQAFTCVDRKILLEGRQLKICGTCFEISVCLFRVVEMVATIAPNLFTDWSKPSAELLLHRLFQLICLVLSRITQKNGIFDSVVSMYITGLESVTHYPMLTVIAGILTTLIMNVHTYTQNLTTQVLLSDEGFQISTLEFMLGNQNQDSGGATAACTLKEKLFCFSNYEEVSKDELASVNSLIQHLTKHQATFVQPENSITEEELCHICCARKKSTVFRPCGHCSCKTCVTHQMLIKKECFFCKGIITSIEDLVGDGIAMKLPSKNMIA